MSDLKYSKDHEWLRVEGDVATMGISQYAQEQLGDIVYVELPKVGRKVKAAEQIATVELVKAASEVYRAGRGRDHRGQRPSSPTTRPWSTARPRATAGSSRSSSPMPASSPL